MYHRALGQKQVLVAIVILIVVITCIYIQLRQNGTQLQPEGGLLDFKYMREIKNKLTSLKVKESESVISTTKRVWPEATNEQIMLECSKAPSGGNKNAGIGDVISLEHTKDSKYIAATKIQCPDKLVGQSRNLTTEEMTKVKECIRTSAGDIKKGHDAFWSGDTQYVRQKHHKYLSASSLIVDIGGNVGEDAEALINMYNPNAYIILEPLLPLYTRLVSKFENKKNIYLYNFGAGMNNAEIYVQITGHAGDATSAFSNAAKEGCLLKIVNTTDVMRKLGVGCFEVDLLTINCEGCEYEVLESILSTNVIKFFRHVQFATHTGIKGLKEPVARYCSIQELLSRTHELSYQYKFNWETWKRKDIKK